MLFATKKGDVGRLNATTKEGKAVDLLVIGLLQQKSVHRAKKQR